MKQRTLSDRIWIIMADSLVMFTLRTVRQERQDWKEISETLGIGAPFLDMIANRRAIRNFKDKPVPKELLEKIVQAITFAPPGFTPIKTEIVVVQDTEVIRKALPRMIEVYDYLVKSHEQSNRTILYPA